MMHSGVTGLPEIDREHRLWVNFKIFEIGVSLGIDMVTPDLK